MRKRVTVILAVLSLASVTVAGIGKAYAYFTTYVEVRGSKQIRIQGETQIEEDFKDWIKSVKITVKEDSDLSYYVRVKTFASSSFTLEPDGKGYWEYNEEDDYWYYKKDGKHLVVEPGQSTEPLAVKITGGDGQEPTIGPNESADVVIAYETVPAIPADFDEDYNCIYDPPDWSQEESGD